jgi:hypothetical protein
MLDDAGLDSVEGFLSRMPPVLVGDVGESGKEENPESRSATRRLVASNVEDIRSFDGSMSVVSTAFVH